MCLSPRRTSTIPEIRQFFKCRLYCATLASVVEFLGGCCIIIIVPRDRYFETKRPNLLLADPRNSHARIVVESVTAYEHICCFDGTESLPGFLPIFRYKRFTKSGRFILLTGGSNYEHVPQLNVESTEIEICILH